MSAISQRKQIESRPTSPSEMKLLAHMETPALPKGVKPALPGANWLSKVYTIARSLLVVVLSVLILASCSLPSSLPSLRSDNDSTQGTNTGQDNANSGSESGSEADAVEGSDGSADDTAGAAEGGTESGQVADSSAQDNAGPTPEPRPTYEPGAIIVPTPTPTGPRPVQIVTFLGETNVMSPIDGPALVGVLGEVAQINAAGGLLGRSLEVKRYNTESRLSVVASLTPTIIASNPDLIITSCDINFSKPILEAAQAASIPTISPCATDPGFLSAAYGSNNFTLGAPTETLGATAAAETLTRLGPVAVVLRDITSPEALAFCDGFESEYIKLGGQIAYTDEFNYDTPAPLQDRLSARRRSGDIDEAALILCSHVPGGLDAAPTVISLLRNIGLRGPIVSGPGLDSAAWFSGVPELGQLLLVTWSSTFGNDPDPKVNDVVLSAARFSDEEVDSDVDIGATTVLGADAITIWADAVRLAQSFERPQVISALGSFVEHPIRTGNITFAGGQRMDTTRKVRVLWVSDGFLDVLTTTEIAPMR